MVVQHSKQLNQLVEQLERSFNSGLTRDISWRKRQLAGVLQMLQQHQQLFSEALKQDLGKSPHESWLTEINFVIHEAQSALAKLAKWAKPRPVSTPLPLFPAKSYLLPSPKGVVLIFGAWNYPLVLTLSPLIAALAAGNCVIVKPSEVSSHTSALIARLLPEFLDQSAVQVVEGDADVANQLLTLRFDHIFYTGNDQVAKIVMAAAAKNLTPVTLELGGKSPAIIADEKHLDVYVRRLVWGKFTNAGQICIAPDYVLVQEQLKAKLIEKLIQEIKLRFGNDPKTTKDYGRIVNIKHFNRLLRLLDNQSILHGGNTDADDLYFEPTLIEGQLNTELMRQEIFGPILPIISFENIQQAIDIIAKNPNPLALYIFTDDDSLVGEISQKVQSGNLCVNDCLVFMANDALPFGGVGTSGIGRYHGQFGFDEFSHLKSVMHRSVKLDLDARYPPYNQTKKAIISFFYKLDRLINRG